MLAGKMCQSHLCGRQSGRHVSFDFVDGCRHHAGPTKLHVNPIFEIGPLEPRFSEWLVFEVRSPAANLIASRQDAMALLNVCPRPLLCHAQGISVDETGKQHFLDATVAYKRAVRLAVAVASGAHMRC
jgi:Acetamidase/Formamidase family